MGFFTSSELNKITTIKIDVDQLEPNCMQCKLYTTCVTSKIKVSGEGRKGILIISEYPSEEEDQYGTALLGSSGKLLADGLREHGISLRKDCWVMNAVSCKPHQAGHHPTKK